MTDHDKMIQASERASHWLAEANVCMNPVKAERLHEKSQFWHDRYNKLAGNL